MSSDSTHCSRWVVSGTGICFLLVAAAVTFYLRTSADDIREAVVRYQLSFETSGRTPYFFVGGSDPTREFSDRFGQRPFAVRGASDCCELRPQPPLIVTDPVTGEKLREVERSGQTLYDKRTGTLAIVFGVGRILPTGVRSVRVSVTYYCGSPCGGAGYYEVVRRNGHWEVGNYHLEMIS